MRSIFLWLVVTLSSLAFADDSDEKLRLASQIVSGVAQTTSTVSLPPVVELEKKLQALDEQMIIAFAKSSVGQFPKLTFAEISDSFRKHFSSTLSQSMQPLLLAIENSTKRQIASYAESFSVNELRAILRKPTALNEKHETFLKFVIEPNKSLEKMAMQSFANRYTNSFELVRRELATLSSEK